MIFLKAIARWLLTTIYRVEVTGLDHFNAVGERVLVVANHTSFLDAVLLTVYLPGNITFAINTHMAKYWWLKPWFRLVQVFPMDPTNPLSSKSLINYIRTGQTAVIFPEGRITVTGTLMKIYDGTGLVAEKADAQVIPIRIEGAQYTPFSRLRGRVRLRWFPKVSMIVLPPRRIQPPENLQGRARRQYSGHELSRIMTSMMFETANNQLTLFQALLDARLIHGSDHIVMEDTERQPLNYRQVIGQSLLLGQKLKPQLAKEKTIGLLLPTMSGSILTFMGLQSIDRVPALLDHSQDSEQLLDACKAGQVTTIITSRVFIRFAKLSHTLAELKNRLNIIYLEDISKNISWQEKLKSQFYSLFAKGAYLAQSGKPDPNSAAVMLFNNDKPLVYTHANLLASRNQLSVVIDFSARDIILNALPLHNAFSLTAGTLLPLLSGMRVFLYPAANHYRIVPEIAYEASATILFGSNDTLKGYAEYAHPYDFYSMRYVFTGGEQLQADTRKLWIEKFGIRLLEGFGLPETGPVLSTNTPIHHKPHTVGQFLPGVQWRLSNTDKDGYGVLEVRGPNVACEGWFNTGQRVRVDEDGYLQLAQENSSS